MTDTTSKASGNCILEFLTNAFWISPMQGNRLLLTEDHDFGELIVLQRLAVRSLVLLERDRLSAQAEAEKVSAIVHEYGSRFENHSFVIEPTRARLRSPP
jgi:predicted nuclease of predicted toxin-antitoxin system